MHQAPPVARIIPGSLPPIERSVKVVPRAEADREIVAAGFDARRYGRRIIIPAYRPDCDNFDAGRPRGSYAGGPATGTVVE